jgi:hypothetical protein
MARRLLALAVVVIVWALVAAPAVGARASVDRVENFDTVLAVAFPEDFPIASLMRADCAFVVRVEHPDGSARETEVCALSDEPVMIPAFQGTPPDRAFHFGGGACIWTSDYWFAVANTPVFAESFSYVVTPSGQVRITSTYPASPLRCA